MKLYGGVYISDDGMSSSIRDMNLQTTLLQNANDNIVGFNKVGYQRKVPVVSSFAEFIGTHAYSETTDTEVGRLALTKRPLDFALAKEGYFQCQTANGIKLTRDGRFKLDKNGYMTNLHDEKVLSVSGQPIKLSQIPDDLDNIKVDKDGTINVIDKKNLTTYTAGQLSVVSNDGSILKDTDVRQRYVENSNVNLGNEFLALIPVRRNFDANRQAFLIQNDELSKVIQELGKTS